MNRQFTLFLRFWLALTASLLFAGCNLPGVAPQPGEQPADQLQMSETANAIFTQAAQTLIAEVTQSAPAPSETAIAPPSDTPQAATDTPAPTPTVTPTETSTFTPTASPAPENFRLVYEEDFSGRVTWYEAEEDRFSFVQEDGEYHILVDFTNGMVNSVRFDDYADVRLETDGIQTGGPTDGYYGLVCRQEDVDNYYALVIGENGQYSIIKVEDGELDFLVEGGAPEGVIRAGALSNRVRADCLGSTLTLYANGQKLAEAEDDDYASGSVGFAVGTRRQPGVEVAFDNFSLWVPR